MTSPAPQETPALVSVGVKELVHTARRLGLVWRLRLATVAADALTPGPTVLATFDGDDTPLTMVNLTGTILGAGDRVAAIQVPPSGIFVIGTLWSSVDNVTAHSEAFGAVLITPVANTPTSASVSYGPLLGTGTVCAWTTPNTSVPGSQVLETSVGTVTTSTMNVFIYRTTTTATTVYWLVKAAP